MAIYSVFFLFWTIVPCYSLIFHRAETGGWRGLRVTDGKVYQVDSNWGTAIYIAVYPKDNKRKGDSEIELENPKTKKLDLTQRCSGACSLTSVTRRIYFPCVLPGAYLVPPCYFIRSDCTRFAVEDGRGGLETLLRPIRRTRYGASEEGSKDFAKQRIRIHPIQGL